MKEIKLAQGKVALIDDDDYERVSRHVWHADKTKKCNIWYARDADGVRMHRLILSAPRGVMIDHKDRNGLNNQKNNLRFCSNSQNQANAKARGGTSQFKGVNWYIPERGRSKWLASTRLNGVKIFLGYFDDEIEAAHAYDAAALKNFGEFATLNFPEENK